MTFDYLSIYFQLQFILELRTTEIAVISHHHDDGALNNKNNNNGSSTKYVQEEQQDPPHGLDLMRDHDFQMKKEYYYTEHQPLHLVIISTFFSYNDEFLRNSCYIVLLVW